MREIGEADALQAFGEHEEALVGHLDDFVHDGQRSDGVEVGGLRRIHAGLALGDDDDGLVFAERVDQLDGAFPADRQGQHGVGEQDRVADGQNGQRAVGGFGRIEFGVGNIGHDFPMSDLHSTLMN